LTKKCTFLIFLNTIIAKMLYCYMVMGDNNSGHFLINSKSSIGYFFIFILSTAKGIRPAVKITKIRIFLWPPPGARFF
jgi:hypothetical protein